jgi:glycosyltransferase involved in cell wall biosynthesis
MSDPNSPAHVLMIAYNFPPDSEVGAQRVTRFCRYLPEHGIHPTVITVEDRFRLLNDGSFPVPPGVRVERTKATSNPLEWFSRLKSLMGRSGTPKGQIKTAAAPKPGFLRTQVLTLLQTPDRYLGWYRPAIRRAKRVLQEQPADAIFSTGPPWTAHLIGRYLQKKYQVRWIADFRDPWALAVWEKKLPGWTRAINRRLEQSCVRRADVVICNTDRLRDRFVEQYPDLPKEKFLTITNGFEDPVSRPVVSPDRQPQPVRLILHLGALYAQRRIDTFCQALADLTRSGNIDSNSLNVLFLGDSDPSAIACANRIAPELVAKKCIEFQPQVGWQRAQEFLWDADLLLLFQGGHRLQVPAKFYEYLLTGKPIFAVTERGALTDLLEATGSGIWASPEDIAEIASKFLSALALKPRTPEEIQQRWAGQFHYRFLTGRLASLIRDSSIAR